MAIAGGGADPQLVMWGERGLVTALFLELSTNAHWQAFLGSLVPPINGDVTDVWSVIEPDFGRRGFGSPDAVSRLMLDNTGCVILLEAKRATYAQTSAHHEQRGMPGFNSTINGQLELNYRLSHALSNYQDGAVQPNDPLQEPDWVVQPYVADLHAPRQLQNPAVLTGIVQEICNRPLESYRHVIITTDAVSPFQNGNVPDRLPRFYNQEGDNIWEAILDHVHWISWDTIAGVHNGGGDGAGGPVVPGAGWFPPTYALNRPNLRTNAGASLRDLGNGRLGRGVSMIRLEQAFFNEFNFPTPSNTFVHFSWRGDNARLRNYLHGGPVVMVANTDEVTQCICHEVAVVQHEPVGNIAFWQQLTLNLNQHPDCDAENRM